MKRIFRQIYNMRAMKPFGGIVFCTECGYIKGYIYQNSTSYLKLVTRCKCSATNWIEIYRGKKPKFEVPWRPLYEKDGVYICQNCENPLFWVKNDSIKNVSFYATCGRCGVSYDRAFLRKKFGEDKSKDR